MKKFTFYYNCKIALAVAGFFALLLLAFCTPKIAFQTSTVVPAAEGTVKVKKDGNSNYSIKVNVMRLSEPQRLTPAKNTYVVWMETAGSGTKNIGQLNTSTWFLSKTMKSSLETVTAFEPLQIYITAENDAAIQYPGSQVVLTTSRF